MFSRPRVALLIESSRAYGRGLLEGIAAYAHEQGPWAMFSQDRGLADPAPEWLKAWEGDGILARVETRAVEEAILKTGLPAVDLRGKYDLDFPLIETNDQVVCRMAADHLLERGFEHFAYCGFEGANYSERRLRYFPPMIEAAGYDCQVFAPRGRKRRARQHEREQHGLLYETEIADWLASLPRPVGIMTCNDLRGWQVLNACRAMDVAVPDEIAVLGVDNDELQCNLSDPPLSSVEPNTPKIGYAAAALLDRMMAGKPAPEGKTFVDPSGVIARQSTDVLAIPDRQVATAVWFIRQNACRGINVSDLLRHVGIPRSSLERRFSKLVGRSPKAEIVRVQIDRIKRLLAKTNFPLPRVAELAGFKHPEYMSVVFKQKTGLTPGQYRKREQVGPDPD